MAGLDNFPDAAALDAARPHHDRVARPHPPLRDLDVPVPFSFRATHALSPLMPVSGNAERTPVMFIDRWGYTEDAWRRGGAPPFAWTWQDVARSAGGQEYVIHDLAGLRGRCGLEWELRPSIDRYRDLLPHEMESRPAFFATHKVSSTERTVGVMAVHGYGYTEAGWEMEGPPSFLIDGEGTLAQFPDGRVLGEDAHIRRLEPGYGAWWDHSAQIGRVALITSLGIQPTPWMWRAEARMDLRDGEIRPFMDLSSRRMLAGHFAALVQASPETPGTEREWIARRLSSSEFTQPSDGVPAWEVRASVLERWRDEVSSNPAAAELAAIASPWLPTHRLEFSRAWGELQDDVMVIGDRAFTKDGWRDGTADYMRVDGEWRNVNKETGATTPARGVGTFEDRAVGWTDMATGRRHLVRSGPRGVSEFTVSGEPLDWTTPRGRREAATVLVKYWASTSEYPVELTDRLTVEAMVACRNDVAWTMTRADLLAALRGDVMVGRAFSPAAAEPTVERSMTVPHESPGVPPLLGPPL